MADSTYIQFFGLMEHIGDTFSAFVAGLDCGDYVVDGFGSVTVPFGSDPDGLFTATWLLNYPAPPPDFSGQPLYTSVSFISGGITHTISIPVALGYSYASYGQTLRPALEADIKSREGSGLAKRRRSAQVGALLDSAVGVSFGTNLSNTNLNTMQAAQFRNPNRSVMDKSTMFSGVYWDTLKDAYSFDGGIAWEVSRPYPTVVMSLTGFVHTEDRG